MSSPSPRPFPALLENLGSGFNVAQNNFSLLCIMSAGHQALYLSSIPIHEEPPRSFCSWRDGIHEMLSISTSRTRSNSERPSGAMNREFSLVFFVDTHLGTPFLGRMCPSLKNAQATLGNDCTTLPSIIRAHHSFSASIKLSLQRLTYIYS